MGREGGGGRTVVDGDGVSALVAQGAEPREDELVALGEKVFDDRLEGQGAGELDGLCIEVGLPGLSSLLFLRIPVASEMKCRTDPRA